MNDARGPGRRRLLAAALIVGLAYLSVEAQLPPSRQPTAWAARTAIRGYQVAGSPAMASMGVRCRYTPTCSHYAAAAIGHYGTVEGLVRTAGRIWRCSPWGGMGYDPAVASLGRVAGPQEETPEQKAQREEIERRLQKAREKGRLIVGQDGQLSEEDKKKIAAATGACVGGCVLAIAGAVGWLAITIFMMLYVLKDGKARGDSNVALWAVLVWLFPILGFIVYFFARPKGDLAPCPNCKAGRLAILAKCPHCGAEAAGGAKSA